MLSCTQEAPIWPLQPYKGYNCLFSVSEAPVCTVYLPGHAGNEEMSRDARWSTACSTNISQQQSRRFNQEENSDVFTSFFWLIGRKTKALCSHWSLPGGPLLFMKVWPNYAVDTRSHGREISLRVPVSRWINLNSMQRNDKFCILVCSFMLFFSCTHRADFSCSICTYKWHEIWNMAANTVIYTDILVISVLMHPVCGILILIFFTQSIFYLYRCSQIFCSNSDWIGCDLFRFAIQSTETPSGHSLSIISNITISFKVSHFSFKFPQITFLHGVRTMSSVCTAQKQTKLAKENKAK